MSNALHRSGIRLLVRQTHDRSNGIGIIVTPNVLLGYTCLLTQLFYPTPKSCGRLLNRMGDVLHRIKLEDDSFRQNLIVSPEDLSLSQMDLTLNVWFNKGTDLVGIIRLFSKGKVPKDLERKTNTP